MGWLRNLIKRKGLEYHNQDEVKVTKTREQSKEEREAEYMKHKERRAQIMENLEPLLAHIRHSLVEKFPCPFKVGDDVILNIYNLKHDGRNSWDGGPVALHNLCKEKNDYQNLVVTGKVTEVRLSMTLVNERIDAIVDRELWNEWDKLIAHKDYAFAKVYEILKRWSESYNMPYSYLSAYWDVFFDTNCEFKPKWGLNCGSWLDINSEEGKLTKQIWVEEIEIEYKRKEIEQQLNAIKQRKNDLEKRYKGLQVKS